MSSTLLLHAACVACAAAATGTLDVTTAGGSEHAAHLTSTGHVGLQMKAGPGFAAFTRFQKGAADKWEHGVNTADQYFITPAPFSSRSSGAALLIGMDSTVEIKKFKSSHIELVTENNVEQSLSLKSGGNLGVYLDSGVHSFFRHHKNGVAQFENGLDPNGIYYMNQNPSSGTGGAAIKIYPDSNVQIPKLITNELKSQGNAVTSVQFDKWFHSGATHTIFQVTGSNVGLTAVAKMDYVTLYAYAGSTHCAGSMVASTRRTINGGSWGVLNNIDTGHACSSGSEFTVPAFFWENGILKLTTSGSVQVTAQFTITYHNTATTILSPH